MLSKSFSFLVILILLIDVSSASAQLKKVRFSTTGISISELPFKVAELRGFWREEGLDVEAILIRGAVGMQALLGGSVDYTSASRLDHRGGRARSAGQARVYFFIQTAV
jgi:ABC-type nitrate/sulfonate/bicarbonate transport system substrate-binding protein